MNPILSYFILPILGILIIIFSILCFFFPFGEKFRDKTQKIKGFGVDLEVSILTLVILIGVVFSFTGIYLQIKNYERQIENSKIDKQTAERALDQERKREITLVVTLEDVVKADDMPTLDDLKCNYYLAGSDNPVPADVIHGYAPATLRIRLKDIKADTYIRQLELSDQKSGRTWVMKGFMPFEPEHYLKKE